MESLGLFRVIYFNYWHSVAPHTGFNYWLSVAPHTGNTYYHWLGIPPARKRKGDTPNDLVAGRANGDNPEGRAGDNPEGRARGREGRTFFFFQRPPKKGVPKRLSCRASREDHEVPQERSRDGRKAPQERCPQKTKL